MSTKSLRGVSTIEFAFVMLVLVPLFLGTAGAGINMVNSLQTIQLARDAGHMYARGVDFTQPGYKQILANLGASVGLSTTTGAGSGSALVILSKLTYVDKAACEAYGLPEDAGGNPIGCTNLTKWVFVQWIRLGNTSLRTSNLGGPLTSGPHAVTIDSGGNIANSDQILNSGDVAVFSGVNPYSNVNGTVTGLPSGQVLYIAEAAATGFTLPPFMTNPQSYSFGIF